MRDCVYPRASRKEFFALLVRECNSESCSVDSSILSEEELPLGFDDDQLSFFIDSLLGQSFWFLSL